MKPLNERASVRVAACLPPRAAPEPNSTSLPVVFLLRSHNSTPFPVFVPPELSLDVYALLAGGALGWLTRSVRPARGGSGRFFDALDASSRRAAVSRR